MRCDVMRDACRHDDGSIMMAFDAVLPPERAEPEPQPQTQSLSLSLSLSA